MKQMKKISAILVIGMISLVLVSFVNNTPCDYLNEYHKGKLALKELQKPFEDQMILASQEKSLVLSQIIFFENDESVAFNEQENSIVSLEENEVWLGEFFKAFEHVILPVQKKDSHTTLKLDDIVYIPEHKDIDLEFDIL